MARRAVSGRSGNRTDAIANALHRGNVFCHQKRPRFGIQIFRNRATDRSRKAHRRRRIEEADGIIAVEWLALIKAGGWIVLNDHGGIIAIGKKRGEHRLGLVRHAPDRRRVIKRIGDGGGQWQLGAQAFSGGSAWAGQIKPMRLSSISKHGRAAPRTGKTGQAAASRHPGNGEKFQRLQHLGRFSDPDHAEPVKERIINLIRARE